MQKFDIKNHPSVYTWMGLNDPQEWQTLEYAKKAAVLPWAYHHVALMADGHIGTGPAIGSVIALKDAVSPAAVGVDIGCGMAAIKYNLKAHDLPDSLADLRKQLEEAIPVGFNSNTGPTKVAKSDPLWDEFDQLDSKVQQLKGKALNQCGTLGGGNHFIEICLDTENNVWLMLHSGSRNIGKEVAEKHIAYAKKLAHNHALEDPNFAVFLAGTEEFQHYVHDLMWCQRYALLNRQVMLFLADFVLQEFFHPKRILQVGKPVFCHHNYVSFENHFDEDVYVTRKGAISAKLGERGIIPGSMGAKSFIVEGLGNPDSFMSASHGAGRIMSRSEAKRRFTKADLIAQTAGVECSKDSSVIDEIPGAYKSIDEVMANQADLVRVIATLKQVLCVKGTKSNGRKK